MVSLEDRYVVTYRHVLRLADGQLVPVDNSKVVVEITRQGGKLRGITSHLSVSTAPGPEPTLDATEAIIFAAEHFEEMEVPIDLSLVSEQHARLTSVRVPVSNDLGYADRFAWAISFPAAPGFAGHEAVVDGENGNILYFSTEDPLGVIPIGLVQPAFPVDPFADFVLCGLTEGRGLDRFGKLRLFSTTAMPIKDFPGTRTFGTTSCTELGRGIGQDDIVTFLLSPPDAQGNQTIPLTNRIWSEDVFTNDFNIFADPSAVETQHWGEKVVAYAKKLGLGERRARAQRDDSPIPMRALMGPNAVCVPTAEWAAYVPDPIVASIQTSLQEANGTMLFGVGEPGKTASWTGPSVIAHEFFHSVVYDQWQVESTAVKSGDWKTIWEGLSECFEMVFINAHKDQMSFDQVEPDPFHLATGVFVSTEDQAVGEPNLVIPRDSALLERGGWRGDVESSRPKHVRATLISGACRLLVSGGHNADPIYKNWAVTPGKDIVHSLGWPAGGGPINQQVAFQRMEQLLIATVTRGKVTAASSIHELIEAMAQHASELALENKWNITTPGAAERVRRAFAVMGWGRGKEDEPNQPNDFSFVLDSSDAAKNLIGTGLHYSRPITGSVCCTSDPSKEKSQDFFVLNERVHGGSTIRWNLSLMPFKGSNTDPGPVRLRIYVDKPCAFPEATATSDSCSLKQQIYPQVNGQGLVKPDLGSLGSQGQVVVPGNKRHIVYVGLSPANEPTLSPGGGYTLSVSLPDKVYD